MLSLTRKLIIIRSHENFVHGPLYSESCGLLADFWRHKNATNQKTDNIADIYFH